MKDLFPGDSTVVEISDIAMPRDLGVGRSDNRVIFVPGAVPGDRVRVELLRGGKGFIYGRLLELERSSPWRRDPPCPHFGSCGGCSLMALDYDQQLEIKKRHMTETFKRIGGLRVDPEIIAPIRQSVDRLFYRGKIELAYHRQGNEDSLGLRKRLSPFSTYTGEVVPIDSCSIFSPVLAAILPAVRSYVERLGARAYDERTRQGFLKGVTVRESKSTGDVMVIIETSKGGLGELESFVGKLCRTVQQIAGVCWFRDGHAEILTGSGWIEEGVEDLRFRIYPGAFFQPNPKTARLLYREVVDYARSIGARRVLGLYCGMGPLEMVLSRSVEWVEGYDADPENIGNARLNARINGILNCRFHTKRIEEINFQDAARSFDLAVIDPPRTGMSKRALKSLLGLELPAIAYISCDPATLSRDLGALKAGGYLLVRVLPFDFFPHTSHLESVVLLQKK